MSFKHLTVLLEETVRAVAPVDGDVIVDCTLGGGGHAEALLEVANCTVIGFDRDPAALEAATARLERFGERFVPVHAEFDALAEALDELGIPVVHGIVADLGVSSPQIDEAGRGFSFRNAGPVDMRMDPTSGFTAADLIARSTDEQLATIIKDYGEERHFRRVARALVDQRPFADTAALADCVAGVVGRVPGRIHPATRTFQALRIAVNDELGQIERLLPQAVARLAPDGRLAVISFHSLEDRIVKRFLHLAAGRGLPRDPYGNPIGEVSVRVAPSIVPLPTDPNPRARSARLRTATRLPWNAR